MFERGLITEDGQVTNSSVEVLRNYMTEFHRFIERVYMVLPRGTHPAVPAQ
jgi:chromate reductase